MNFLKGFTITGFSTILITLVAFFNNVIVTRQIGADGRGKYVVISNIIVILSLLLGEGIRRTNTLLISEDKRNLAKLVVQTLIYAFVISVLFLLFYFIDSIWKTIFPNITDNLFFITLVITVIIILWRAFQAIFLGLGKIIEFNMLQIISTVTIFLINLVGIYFFNFGLLHVVLATLAGAVISFFLSLVLLNIKISRQDFSYDFFKKKSSKLSAKSTLSAIEIYLTLKVDVFIINFFLNSAMAGIYSIALIFTEMFQKIPNIAGPLLITKSANDKTRSSEYITARIFRIVLAFDIVASLLLVIIGKDLIVFLFRNEFEYSYYVLLFLLPAIVLYGPGTIIHAYFMGKGFPIKSLIINGIVALLNIFANIILIPVYGIIVAAIISSITYSLWTLLFLVYFRNVSNIPYQKILILQMEDISDISKSIKKLIRKK